MQVSLEVALAFIQFLMFLFHSERKILKFCLSLKTCYVKRFIPFIDKNTQIFLKMTNFT